MKFNSKGKRLGKNLCHLLESKITIFHIFILSNFNFVPLPGTFDPDHLQIKWKKFSKEPFVWFMKIIIPPIRSC